MDLITYSSSPFFPPYFLYSPAHTPLKPSPSWVTNIMPFLLRAASAMKTWRPYAHRHCLTELLQDRQQNTWQPRRNGGGEATRVLVTFLHLQGCTWTDLIWGSAGICLHHRLDNQKQSIFFKNNKAIDCLTASMFQNRCSIFPLS